MAKIEDIGSSRMTARNPPQILLATCGAGSLPRAAKGFEARDALAGLWITNKNSTQVSQKKYRRCWPFHLAMKPFYHLAPQIWTEHAFYAFFPIWRAWLHCQSWPRFDVVQAIMGFVTEPFDMADRRGALKVVDFQDGVEGFIVRGRDPKHIAEAMIKIVGDPAMNQKMGEAAYQKGARHNTWQDYGDRVLKALSEPNPGLKYHAGIRRCATAEFDARRMRAVLYECFQKYASVSRA